MWVHLWISVVGFVKGRQAGWWRAGRPLDRLWPGGPVWVGGGWEAAGQADRATDGQLDVLQVAAKTSFV